MHSKFKETLVGVGVCWLALHAVALFIYSNGQATSDNLAWQMLLPVLMFERYLIQIVVTLAIAVAAILIAVNLFGLNRQPPKPEEVSAFVTPTKAETSIDKSARITEPIHKPLPPKPPEIIIPPPPKPPPTAKELKQKAIEQITGRRFL